MARKRSPRQQKLMALLLAPVNWLEERSGLVGPSNTSSSAAFPPSPTGSTLSGRQRSPRSWSKARHRRGAGDVLPALSGRGLRLDPEDHERAHPGAVARPWHAQVGRECLHHHSSSCTWGRVFLTGAYKYPRELNWLIGVILTTLALAEAHRLPSVGPDGLLGHRRRHQHQCQRADRGSFLGDFLRGGAGDRGGHAGAVPRYTCS